MWLNNLPLGVSPIRWEKIKQYVEIINTTDKETVLKGWEKTKLSSGFDLGESMLDKEFSKKNFY